MSSIKMNENKMDENKMDEKKEDPYIETPWTIIESYFKGHHLERLVRHQLESYNNFVGYQIMKTIEMFNPVHIKSEQDYDPASGKYSLEIFVSFENFHIYRPQIHENNGATKLMFPQEARLRNFTYSSAMTIDIQMKFVIRTGANLDNIQTFHKVLPKIHIGKMPIMLKSNICVLSQYKHVENNSTGECKYDAGGYFIINGSEKTVLGQERAAENKVYCFNISKNNTKYTWMAEIKSIPDFKCISPKQINMMISSKNNGFGFPIWMQLPRVKQPVPLFVVFRALGLVTDKEICEKIVLDIGNERYEDMLAELQGSIMDANIYMTQEESIRYIMNYVMYTPINMDKETGSKKKYEFTMDILNNDLFPHCNTGTQKIYFLGYMTNRLLQASLGWIKQDDRDSYLNKRIDLTGALLNNLFRNYFNKLVKDMEKQIVKEINTGSWKSTDDYQNIVNMTNIYKIIKSTTIENGIKRALSTGDFGIKHTNSNKVGVAQVLNRLTYVSSLSHARRISTPADKSGKLIPPRKLHSTGWGYLCITGDTDILLSNRIDSVKIRDIKDGTFVNTVNRSTLLDEPSDIHHFFCKMPDKLYEITTISGRKIKATADHPLLVLGEKGYEMKKVGEMNTEDKVIVRHMIEPMMDEDTVNTSKFIIHEDTVLEHYRMDLLEKNLLNVNIPLYKLKIIARLIGALNTDGHISERKDEKKDKIYYEASFHLGEEYDVFQVADDIKNLGFDRPSIGRRTTKFEDKTNGRTTTYNTWEVLKNGSFAYFMNIMGAFSGKKTNISRKLPDWLVNCDLSIKREFLSSFQGGDGSRLSYQKNGIKFKPSLGITFQTTNNEYLSYTIDYMTQIKNMFEELNIECRLSTKKVNDEKSKVCIVFEKSTENLLRYANKIGYTYCEEKRRNSAPVIEHLKIREYKKRQRDESYQYIIENYNNKTVEQLFEKTKIPENQIKKVMYNDKNGIHQRTRFTTDTTYEDFIRDNIVENGCVAIKIESIREIEPEMVYDFTTTSENHSFVASSFVSSNCGVETPEGQSVGLVKNLAYMAHVTIPSNTMPIYDYVMPHIIDIGDKTPMEMFGKVKVFINGCWVGITEEPMTLYQILKEKKAQGIINIYTSIVFHYGLGEIRVCNDGGRITRPLLRVKDNKTMIRPEIMRDLKEGNLTWDDLLTNVKIEDALIEYIDPEEQEYSMVAMKPKELQEKKDMCIRYTHCEIHPSTIFGVLASCVPFPEHNQSPRNTYQCLDLNELVKMADGSKKPIKDVKVGDEVLTFHPETFELTTTKVMGHFVRPNEMQLLSLVCRTLEGEEHSIVATVDHKFMTNKGWRSVLEIYYNWIDGFPISIGYFDEEGKPKDAYVECIVEEEDGLVSDITVENTYNQSFLAGSANFMSHNCAQAKQAMGVYVTNYDNRMDKTAYVLNYPGRPLVDTRIMDMIHINKIPSGFTVVVAIMTHTGYNQEDSLLFNKGSIDRGLFQATIYHTEKDEDKQKINGDEEIRCKPDPNKTKGMKFANYSKINSKGVVPENTLLQNRDIIISKIVPIKENRNDHTKLIKYEDQSRVFRTDEETYVDKNYIDRNGDGYNFAKVRTRTVRKPVIGDKFSSRSGQKGTIGNIIQEADMPFTSSGIKPDLILNPHAIPSRMTIAQLKETVLAKVLLELGLLGDGTSFGELDVNTICEHLLDAGFEAHGNELMHDGLTGEQMECSIFTGPVFYQRLKHMVADKQHSRSIGPMVNLTRQPAEGRSRDGGLRFGEMERDTTVAHGAARFTKERLFDVSDKYYVHTCKKCGMIASYNDKVHIHRCRTCDNRTDFSYVEIPYACKLLFQELITMNIAPRIMT